LTSEIARMSDEVRENYTISLFKLLDEFQRVVPNRNSALAILLPVVGAMTMARAVTDNELAMDILNSGKLMADRLLDQD
ncbi:MAG: hypothetical protein AAF197_09755, partial [Pseudomonadota bacterium]